MEIEFFWNIYGVFKHLKLNCEEQAVFFIHLLRGWIKVFAFFKIDPYIVKWYSVCLVMDF